METKYPREGKEVVVNEDEGNLFYWNCSSSEGGLWCICCRLVYAILWQSPSKDDQQYCEEQKEGQT